jgi:hypothetical protein
MCRSTLCFAAVIWAAGLQTANAQSPPMDKVAPDPLSKTVVVTEFGTKIGGHPGGAIVANDGMLYGTSENINRDADGELAPGRSPVGTIWRATPWGTKQLLHAFDGVDGGFALAPLVQGADGALYGGSLKALFRVTTDGQFSVLHYMDCNGPQGCGPDVEGLVLARDGKFYGVADYAVSSLGTFYSVTSDGSFELIQTHLGQLGRPTGGILEGDDDSFYLVMAAGLLRVTRTGVVTELATIEDNPHGGLTYDANHEYMYGVTGSMRVYRYKDKVVETVATLDPHCGVLGDLALGPDGVHFYTACGNTIYSISPQGDVETVAVAPDRVLYWQRLVFDSKGAMYGTTWEGGAKALGMMFRVTGY